MTIKNCYAKGLVNEGNSGNGFLASEETAGSVTVEDCFWDTETSGRSTSLKGVGKTTAQMKNITTFTDTDSVDLDEAWDMLSVFKSKDKTWVIDNTESYPFFPWANEFRLRLEGNLLFAPNKVWTSNYIYKDSRSQGTKVPANRVRVQIKGENLSELTIEVYTDESDTWSEVNHDEWFTLTPVANNIKIRLTNDANKYVLVKRVLVHKGI